MRHNRLRLKSKISKRSCKRIRLRLTSRQASTILAQQIQEDFSQLDPQDFQDSADVIEDLETIQRNLDSCNNEGQQLVHSSFTDAQQDDMCALGGLGSDELADNSNDIDDAFVLSLETALFFTLSPFLSSSAGGKLDARTIKTTTNQLASFMIWAYATRNDKAALPVTGSMTFTEQSGIAVQLTIDLINEYPQILEEYATRLESVFRRAPSTILNHLDMLDKLHHFALYGCQVSISVPLGYNDRYTFYAKRCKRVFRKALKKYK